MRSIADIHDRVSDTLNSIVVKELRQAVNSNFLAVTLVLFLVLQLLVVGLGLANESLSGSFHAGRSIFRRFTVNLASNMPAVRTRLCGNPFGN